MKKQKIFRALKAAAEYFTTGGGAVSLVIGFVALVVVVPPFISVPIILVAGGICAYIGGSRKWEQMKIQEARAEALEVERQEVNQKHEEALRINRNLDKRMAEIVKTERKIQLKLDKHMALQSKYEMEHKEALERQQQECQQLERVLHTPTVNHRALTVSQDYDSANRPQVTIKISNLPTFFTLDNKEGRASPASATKTSRHSVVLPEERRQNRVSP